jgi:hypothetical protein
MSLSYKQDRGKLYGNLLCFAYLLQILGAVSVWVALGKAWVGQKQNDECRVLNQKHRSLPIDDFVQSI